MSYLLTTLVEFASIAYGDIVVEEEQRVIDVDSECYNCEKECPYDVQVCPHYEGQMEKVYTGDIRNAPLRIAERSISYIGATEIQKTKKWKYPAIHIILDPLFEFDIITGNNENEYD